MSNTSHKWIASIAIAFSLGLIVFPAVGRAQSVSELESLTSRFNSDANDLFRLDSDAHHRIWEAYCGEFDVYLDADRELAADFARQLQTREQDQVKQVLNLLPNIRSMAEKLQSGPDSSKVKELMEGVNKKEGQLNDLSNGVVLKGSNHPFVQYAIEYGKQKHESMCDSHGGTPKVCDKNFPNFRGRPDLVTVEGGHLVIYEFKPNNDRAKSEGEKQVEEYLPEVVAYYQEFFPEGRNGKTKGKPDGDLGGENMLTELKKSDTWVNDNMHIEAIPHVDTYNMCEDRPN
jgi:hypothetical protein